ncbi:MAG: glycosyltransferase family 9 protein [Aureliella sp.]
MSTPSTPRRILITRLSAIGDCLLTIPVAVEAKKLWPRCEITWVVDCAAEQFLRDHPAVDEVIRIEKSWLKKPNAWRSAWQQLRTREFDVVLDPQGLTKSSMLGWMSGARWRVGFDRSHGRELGPLLANRRVRRTNRHMVDTYRQVLSPWATIEPGQGQFAMPRYPSASQVESELKERDLTPGRWIALNPGAGWTTRIWPTQRFGIVAREAFERLGVRSVVFWAGEEERLMAEVIAETSGGAAMPAPATSLTDMLEWLRRARMLVTADTGPLHMASAVGTPCISLHGVTWSDESGPYGNLNIAIQSPITPAVGKLIRKGPNTAMQAIETSEVVEACLRLNEHIQSAEQPFRVSA